MNNDERPDTMNPPQIIYLQLLDLDGDPSGEVTWCVDRIHDTDVEYVRVGTFVGHSDTHQEDTNGD